MFRKLMLPLVLTFSVILAACAAPLTPTATAVPPTVEPTPAPITLTDGLGRTVTLAAPAQRIVSLAASNTEIVFAIGAGKQLVGREEFSDYPPEALNVPSIGSLYPKANAEAIVALQPDLVLAAGITSPDDVKTLADLGLTVYATRFTVTLDDIYADIAAVGQLSGHSADAEKLMAEMKARAQAVADAIAPISARPSVFYEVDATDPAKPYTAGKGTFIDQLLTLAGGSNVGAIQDSYFQMSLEEMVTQNPAIIVLGSATFGGQTPALVAQRAGWESIAAVQNKAVYAFDDNLVSRPGPRVIDGLEALAKLIHPGVFK